MHKAQLKIIGLVTVLIYLVFGLAALIMSGINFQVLHVQWSEGPWTHLAPIELAVTIYLVVTAIVGVLTFTVCSPNKGVIMFVSTYTYIHIHILIHLHLHIFNVQLLIQVSKVRVLLLLRRNMC